MNLAMITQTPKGGFYLGKEGGILNAIVGSLYLATGATFLAILISLPVVLYLNVYAKKGSRIITFTRFGSIVFFRSNQVGDRLKSCGKTGPARNTNRCSDRFWKRNWRRSFCDFYRWL